MNAYAKVSKRTAIGYLLTIAPVCMAQPGPTPVAYSVVCDDYALKLVIEQKLVTAIQAVKGFAVDPSGKEQLRLLLAVAAIKRKKDKVDETLGLSIEPLASEVLRSSTLRTSCLPRTGMRRV